ncbi:MAG: hypothetical protein R2762_09565 [Bryobacteraceae bacterium]
MTDTPTAAQTGSYDFVVAVEDAVGAQVQSPVFSGTICGYSISPTSASTSSNGGVGSVAVTAPGGCAWTAVERSRLDYRRRASASGSGNGTVSYTVAANGGANRMGTITVAEANFTVTQGGAGEPVVVGMSPASGTGSSGCSPSTSAILTASRT